MTFRVTHPKQVSVKRLAQAAEGTEASVSLLLLLFVHILAAACPDDSRTASPLETPQLVPHKE
jgi:hypothetical protein